VFATCRITILHYVPEISNIKMCHWNLTSRCAVRVNHAEVFAPYVFFISPSYRTLSKVRYVFATCRTTNLHYVPEISNIKMCHCQMPTYGQFVHSDFAYAYDENDELAIVGPTARVLVQGYWCYGEDIADFPATVADLSFMPEIGDFLVTLRVSNDVARSVNLPEAVRLDLRIPNSIPNSTHYLPAKPAEYWVIFVFCHQNDEGTTPKVMKLGAGFSWQGEWMYTMFKALVAILCNIYIVYMCILVPKYNVANKLPKYRECIYIFPYTGNLATYTAKTRRFVWVQPYFGSLVFINGFNIIIYNGMLLQQ
jgi:hypothetical protein